MTTTTPRQGCQPAPYPPADAGQGYWDACEPPCWWAARGTLVQQENPDGTFDETWHPEGWQRIFPPGETVEDNRRAVIDRTRTLGWPLCEAAGCEQVARWLVVDPPMPESPWEYCDHHV